MPNWYATRDGVKRAVRLHGSENDEAVDRLIEAASRDVDNLTHRRFIPETATKLIRWPSRMGYGSVLWLEADLISITTLQSEAQNSSPTTITTTTVLTVERAYNGTTLAAHSDGVAVHIFRTLAVTRAVNGTTAASHSDSTAITAYRAPGAIRELTLALAIASVSQEAASWGRTIGAGEGTQAMSSTGLDALMDRVVGQYVRPREAAI
jgi:hypothetical protein